MTVLDDLFDAYNAALMDADELEEALVEFDYMPVKRPAEYLLEEDPNDFHADQWTFPQDDTTQQVEDAVYMGRVPAELGTRVFDRLRGVAIIGPDSPKVLAPEGAKAARTPEARSAATRKAWLKRQRRRFVAPLTAAQVTDRKAAYEKLATSKEWGLGGPHDSMEQHSEIVELRNGSKVRVWDPARRQVHEQLLGAAMRDAVGRGVPAEHKALVLGGLGGAGKSSILKRRAEQLGVDLGDPPDADAPKSHIVVNPDLFKEQLVARGLVDVMPGFSPMESASLVHEESSYLADRLRERAQAAGLNIILDGTLSNKDSAERKAHLLSDDGYTVDGVFVDVSTSKSKASANARYARGINAWLSEGKGLGGRPVPDSFIDGSTAKDGAMVPGVGGRPVQARSKNRVVFHELADAGVFATASVFDNEGDGGPTDYPGTEVWTLAGTAHK